VFDPNAFLVNQYFLYNESKHPLPFNDTHGVGHPSQFSQKISYIISQFQQHLLVCQITFDTIEFII